MTPRRFPAGGTLLALALLLLVTLVVAASLGDVALRPSAVARAVLHRAVSAIPPADDLTAGIVWELRLPRVLLAALVGATLSVAGVSLQGLLGNPLADPYTIGVSSGASVGAGAAILLGLGAAWGGLALPLMAFAAALLTMLLVFALARVGGTLHAASFLLAGIIAGSFLWAVMTLLLSLAQQEQRTILNWLMGRFADADWSKVALLFPLTLGGTLLLAACGRGLDAFSFGEDTARSVGVEVERFKAGILALAALLTAASVSVSGIIGFVGLVVPHLARSLVGPPHRTLLPAAALLGAILTVLADLIARLILPGQEIPVGVVTALIGAPFFCLLLRRQMGQ
ncbi:MAG: iron ABC transporter permease [Cytophagales bacterium]|nr:iron ABC transporter permease [Armatimonadota bacterium]